MIKKICLYLFLSFYSFCSIAGAPDAKFNYLCTGFFISADGYIGTAGHCHGTNMRIVKDGQVLPVTVVAVDKEHDTMLLKADLKDLSFYSIALIPVTKDTDIAFIGYPRPNVYGWYKHTRKGTINSDSLDDGLYTADLWIRPGVSGSCVFNSNGACIGIATVEITALDFELEAGLQPITTLSIMALNNYVAVSFSSQGNGPIDDERLNQLFVENYAKTVLIIGD